MARTRQPARRKASARCQPTKPVAPVMLTEQLFIQPVRLVTPAAHGCYTSVDSVVVFERPRELSAPVSSPETAAMELRDQQRIETHPAHVRHDAKQQHPRLIDDRVASQ